MNVHSGAKGIRSKITRSSQPNYQKSKIKNKKEKSEKKNKREREKNERKKK